MDSYLSRARERRRYLDSVKKLHTLHAVNCTLETCPQWRRCSQVGLQTRLFGQGRADVFFLFDSPGPQEVEEGLPLMGRLGSVFRDAVLRPFVQKTPGISYALGYLVRSIQEEEGKKFLKKEYNSCWHNLMSDLSRHRPRLIVAFGSSVFSFLVSKAINKREIELKIADNPVMTNLRQHLFKLRLLDDYEPELLVAYSPGFVLSNPSATRYLDDDSARIISAAKGKYSPEDPAAKESRIKIDKIEILKTEDQAINFLDQLADGLLFSTEKAVAFDTETLNLNRKFNNAFLSWQFSYAPGHAVVLPMEHPDCPIFEKPSAKIRLVQVAQRLFNNPSSKSRIRCFVAHNAKFDLAVLYGSLGIIQRQEDAPYVWCTQNAMHWLDENRKSLARFLEAGDKPYSLKTLGKEFFNFRYRAQHLELRSEGNLSELSIDDLAEYGGSDTILTLALYEHQLLLAQEQPKEALKKLTDFQKYYYSKTNRSLALMECNGLYVSSDHISFLQGSDSPIWNRLNEIKHKLLQKSPEVLDFRKKYHHKLCAKTNVTYDDLWGDGDSSVEELVEFDHKKKIHRDAFYLEFLKLEPLEYSQKTKEPSFDSGFLEHYSKPENYKQAFGVRPYLAFYNTPKEDSKGELVYPPNPIQLIAELQKLEKLASGYLVSMQKLLDDKGGDCRDSRVRASFHPTGTDTGRLSSCIAKGTRIEVVRDVGKYPEGIPIEDVKEGDLVYCYDNDPVSPKLTLKKVLWAGQTGHKEVIRLHWIGTGRRHKGHLDLTPDHLVRLVDGSYKEASTLNPSDQILALNRVTDPDGYSFLYYRGRSSFPERDHRFIYQTVTCNKIKDKFVVHHRNGLKLDNNIDNLEVLSLSEHSRLHSYEMDPICRQEAAKKISRQWSLGFRDHTIKYGKDHPLFIYPSKFSILRAFAKEKGLLLKAKNHICKDYGTFIKKCELYEIDWEMIKYRYDMLGNYLPKWRVLKALRENESQAFKQLKVGRARMTKLLRSHNLHLKTRMEYLRFALKHKGQIKFMLASPYCPGRDYYETFDLYKRKNIDIKEVSARFDKNGRYISKTKFLEAMGASSLTKRYGILNIARGSENQWQYLIKTYMGYNHRVVKIERLEDPVDVYDLHIEDVNNFIANELCVHNSSPNFQNLPAGRSKAAKEIKNMFQAEPPSKRWPNGTCLIQVDYAAAEVFWAVNFSQEPELVSFLNKCADDLSLAYESSDSLSDEEFEKIILSTDFHKRTASLMFEIPAETVSKQMRQESKAITFGLLYGKTTQGLAADNGWTVEEAEAKMRKFFSAFPRLERWLKEQIATARRHGYVETLMGRRRRLSHFYATKQPKHAGEADRKAMNSPIQGQSSDAGVIGLNNFVEYVLKNNLEKRWLVENVVHDSILFQVPMEDIEAILPVIKTSLTTGMRDYIERHWSIKIPVTLRCDFELGLRYGDLHGWDQRAKTLRPLLEKIASDAEKLWGVGDKNESSVISLRKPSPSLDLVTWQGHP